MTNLEILQELGIPLFTPRAPAQKSEKPESILPLIITLSETVDEFSEAHQEQLGKILAFLNFTEQDYVLSFKGQEQNKPCDILLSFGKTLDIPAGQSVQTHSISAMLEQPACKREVLHAIRPLQKA